MKSHILLNAGAGDYWGNPVLYPSFDKSRSKYITIRKTRNGSLLYYAYNIGFTGSFVTLKGATRQILIGEKETTYYQRYWK